MELGEYDHRLGANDPTDFPGERFKEKELESNPSDSTGNFTIREQGRNSKVGQGTHPDCWSLVNHGLS